MTVAIASPRAGWAPMSRRFHCRFTLATSPFPSAERQPRSAWPDGPLSGPTVSPDVARCPTRYGAGQGAGNARPGETRAPHRGRGGDLAGTLLGSGAAFAQEFWAGVARDVGEFGTGPAHLRWPPVPPAEQHHRGRQEQGTDEEGVHQHAQRETRTDITELSGSLLGAHDRENGERAAEHQPGRRDRGPGRDERAAHRFSQRKTLCLFPDPA